MNSITCELARFAQKFGSDKQGGHYYMPHYERFFTAYRSRPIGLLEIGVGGYNNPALGGESLLVWESYFPHATIFGLDFFDKSGAETGRSQIFQGSQADVLVMSDILRAAQPTGGLDIIIDDGSHRSEHIIATFQMLFPHLNPGGVYVVEDLQTSYWPAYAGSFSDVHDAPTAMVYFKKLVDGLNWQELHRPGYQPNATEVTITSISFYHNLVFIEKGSNLEGSNLLTASKLPGL